MYKFPFKALLSIMLSLLVFSACNSVPAPPKKEFIEYLPPSFEELPEKIEAEDINSSRTETSPPKNTEIWDLSNVDISYIDPSKKLIAFTFDDAPSRTLENILTVFASFNEMHPDCRATATVFFNGGRCDNHSRPLLYTAAALGFELGNHTHSHFDLTTLNEAEIELEISKTDELLFEIDHNPTHLLRAPFGKTNELVKSLSKTPIIDWTIDTLDWTRIDENAIYEQVFSLKKNGSIVLMHDGYTATVSALKRLLPDLADSGYQVVSVSALAKAHNCTLRRGRTYIRARKQGTN